MVAQTYISSQQAAAEIGVSRRRMGQFLAAGRVVGAKRVGRAWIVPSPVKLTPGRRGPSGAADRTA